MANKWTEQQRQAIEARGGDLLIAAAAGSGKTAVLVERIITRILEEGQEIDRLLVVTFTKAAASEMSQRIGSAIAKRLEENPKDVHLQNQMALLPRADIKTIHAFCLQVIREYYHLLEIDPAVRTADPAEIKLLQKEVLDELFEECYAAEEPQWFYDLLESFSSSTQDTPLRELVLNTYLFAQGSPRPEEALDALAESFHLAEGASIDTCCWFPMIRQGAETMLEYACYQIEKAYQMAEEGEFEGYHKLLEKETAMLQHLRAAVAEPYAAWRLPYLAVEFARLPAYRGERKAEAERIKELRNEAKDTIKKLGELYFAYPPEMQEELVRKLGRTAEHLARLTKAFMQAFAAAKKEKNVIDFNDYEHFALQILLSPDGTPTEAAAEVRQKYDEIMIDEYQDSNLVQELLLAAVSGESIGENDRFMVGDVKQSIYRFRQAMPELFNEKYLRYPAAAGGKERKIILSKNFRSRKNILDGVNFIFRQIMQADLGGIAYDKEAALYEGAPFPPCEGLHGGANEMLLVETAEPEDSQMSEELQEMGRRQVEATAIVGRIRELMESGYQVLDKESGSYRPLRYGDVAVLLRSMKNWSGVLEEVFGNAGMPYYAETAEGYFEVPEVETMLHLLRLIDNPRQDIPLLSILHSPLYGFSADALMQIRLAGGKGAYYDCVCTYAATGEEAELRESLVSFLTALAEWRQQAKDISLHGLLRLLYQETGYYDYLGMTAGGELRQANLRLLLEKAEEYEKGSHKGLFYFIRYVEDMKTAEAETAAAKLPSEEDDRIQVMTIHKSKGLEFPIVFVADLGKTFNEMDTRNPVLFHQKWGCGMDYVDLEQRVSYRTLAKRALAEALREESLAEEIRVLYVALTRAKEKLILTGTVKQWEKAVQKWMETADCKTESFPASRLRRARSYLDWVMPALLRHPIVAETVGKLCETEDAAEFLEELPRLSAECSQWELRLCRREAVLRGLSQEEQEAAQQRDFFADWKVPKERTAQQQEVFRVLSWQYPYGRETGLPAKLSISEIKRKYQEEMLGEVVAPVRQEIRLPKPEEEKKLQGAALGTAMHTFLEEADLRQSYDMEQIEALAAALVEKGRLTPTEAASLRKKELLRFFHSPLAERMRAAAEVQRERTFSLLMQPKEIFFGEAYQDVEEWILVNGIIDCYFIEEDQIVLLDYKSDRVYDEEKLKERYHIQMQLYCKALERSLGLPVKEIYLYSFALGRAILLERTE